MENNQDTGVLPNLEEMVDSDKAFYIDYSRVQRHQKRVMEISMLIAEDMNLPEKRKEYLRIAARLHDFGKRIWPCSMIYKKKEELDDYEKALIDNHPIASTRLIINDLMFYGNVAETFETHYPEVLRIIECHHENHDGSGYPYKFKGDEIPLESAIIHVADAYDAMRSPRLYRKVDSQLMTHKTAVKKIKEKSGIEFHPKVVAAFLRIPEADLEKIHESVNYIPKRRITEMYGPELSDQIRDN